MLQLTRVDAARPVSLEIVDSPVPQEQLRCGRHRVWVYGDGTLATRNIHALVANTLDQVVMCGVEIPDCQGADLTDPASVPEPELAPERTDRFARVVQCRTNGSVQTLIVQEATRTCADCVCTMPPQATVYFTDATGAPPWWPCGDTIPFCTSPLPLYFMDALQCPAD